MDQQQLDFYKEEERFIKGILLHYIFYNEENFYTVAKIKIKETTENYDGKEITITGSLPLLYEQETYTFYGDFIDHPRFGNQYHVRKHKRELPQTKHGIVQYLSGDLFSGIGKKTAEHIVDALGERAISKILNNPAVLEKVPKLSEEKAQTLYQTLKEHEGLERVMIALSDYGFGPQLSMKIYKAYKQETIEVIRNNPYQLIHDVEGIGFKRADELGKTFGISGKHPERIRAGCLYWLSDKSVQEGHAFLQYETYISGVQELLDDGRKIDEQEISRELIGLYQEEKIILDKERIYLPSLYFSEKGLVTNIEKLMGNTDVKEHFSEAQFYEKLEEIEKQFNMQYGESQKRAIHTALTSPVMILTGGPGTGKTTVIKGIVEIYAKLHDLSLNRRDYSKDNPFPIVLAAPTGRAAKRMSESTALPAVTIHRLLGWKGEGFEHDEDHPISGKLLIVDEVSMVDLWLAHQLFKCLPKGMQVILVGDEDQLPSVGPGQVLKDLLDSAVIPTVRLTDIYRQAEGSSIIQLAHHIKNGELPDDLQKPTHDRRFFPCTQEQIGDAVEQICKNAIGKGYTANEIQVLAPMYRGNAGVEKLNRMLQELFNPKKETTRELQFGDLFYRVGDKVLQLVNDTENNVFNGDIGQIVAVFYAKENTEKEDQLVVSFDGIEVVYGRNKFNQLTHAYCCSIHKSQGSEFPIVILPIVKGYFRMLRRNLIYTAITRSKEFLLLCGEEAAIKMAVEKYEQEERNSMLKTKLQERLMEIVSTDDSFLDT
ncbi:SF1B family DNA helicase RecD2 [Bacillus taeanensis]|uniref:ATP-dependent RecD2 DNA helicase n=1 Tax=Bacillus taeanensis TaxID=273032 RepID=A0A366Y221_9BACI|nr:ATP-dependent RecD-like DNA helicase [Bacillus taeanensis]RBW70444.1 ATP-dependent RecD-like DNA helicase [Bacillus taeanensis]